MKRVRFPVRVKRGSSVVSIYKTPTRGYPLFTVVHYDAEGRRSRRVFADYDQARHAADETVLNLAGGKSDMLTLTGQELLIYRRATEALKDAGVSLDVAAIQFVQSVRTPNGGNGVGAGAPGVQPVITPKPVAEVVEELLASKRAKGRSALYLTDLRIRLTRFAEAVPGPIHEITTSRIDDFLKSLGIAARSQNNFRSSIGTLLKFAKAKGYLDKDHPGVTLIEKASHVDKEVLVFTPEEITTLLNGAKRELVPALAIGAFAGVRSQELKRLEWDNIRLREGHIEITSASSKTRIRRLIPIQRNLKAWLLPLSRDCGPVTPFANLALQFAKLARKTGVRWKKNGLRHSFISYRVGQINDVAAVSLEAGNSPQVVARHYLKCVTGAASRAWFNVMPHPGVAKHPKAIRVQQPR
ncbi:MAG TPA: hypothetical protein P5186_28485 [Candidatus Paceibacterota bacterium]|nr:hypothetical protein [Verrucomicrobiota bacterium]HRY51987.1 hypothetical protein [Candidatus Paceibacterota bacterium]